MAEKETLGIFVPTNKHIDHVIGVTRAAKKADKDVVIFFTHEGVLMTQDPKYQEIADLGPDEMTLCNVRWEELGLKGKPIPAGMGDKGLATQSRHVALIGTCDRYMVL
ncbi:MAG: DsrE family protein [Proteobacteria bacterium]|nr:DsrE family protein [Pseudomonadota bacterium]MBU1903855.1 DsrE family protein [Pseudomonadota bacterium]